MTAARLRRDPRRPDARGSPSDDLAAPLYVAWQITNECNLACLHCIEESGPGKAFPDELAARGPRRHRPDGWRWRSRTSRSRAASRWCIRTSSRWSSTSARRRQLKIETNGHYLDAGELRAPAAARRQGRAGEPRRRVARDVQPDARARRVRHRRRRHAATCARPACRSRSTSHRRASTSTRSARPWTSRTSSAHTASTPAARCTPATRSRPGASSRRPRISTRRSSTTLRAKAEEYRGRMRVHFHEMGLLEELRYRLAAAGGAADRPAQRPREADQRAAVRLRRPAHGVAGARSGPTSSARGATRASRASSTTSRTIRARRRRCTSGSTSEHAVRCAVRRANAGAAAAARGQPRPLPLLPLRGTAALPARRGVGARGRGPLRGARSSGADSSASCSQSSASKRSTNTSTRGWAPTASSIPRICRRSRWRCSGSASSRSPARSRSACT